VSFQDEESRFVGCLGSRSLTGTLAPEVEQAAVDHSGVTLAAGLREAGRAEAPRARLAPGRYAGFVEAHIEQGPDLEHTGRRICVVSRIVGRRSIRVFVRGRHEQ